MFGRVTFHEQNGIQNLKDWNYAREEKLTIAAVSITVIICTVDYFFILLS